MSKIYYLDESEHSTFNSVWGMHDKIYVMGGYTILSKQIFNLKRKLDKIKSNNGIPIELPVKWNFKDRGIKDIYKDKLGEKRYGELVKNADKIRKEMLLEAQDKELDIVITISATYKDLVPKGRTFFSECFVNCLQRVGLDLKYGIINNVIVVVDSIPENRQKEMFNIFGNAFYRGEDDRGNPFHSGPLKNYGTYPSLLTGSDLHSTKLQLADIFIGATKSFLTALSSGKGIDRAREFFSYIVPLFRKSYNGEIIGHGLILPKRYRDIKKVHSEIAVLRKS